MGHVKMKLKTIALLFILFTLTGCTGEYKITISKDLSVKEEATFLKYKNSTKDEFLAIKEEIIFKYYSYQTVSGFTRYNKDYIIDENKYGIRPYRTYTSLSRITESPIIKLEFESIDIIKTEDTIITMTISDPVDYGLFSSKSFDAETLEIDFNIKVDQPYYIVTGNYNEIKDGVMIWKKEDVINKGEIKFSFDTSKLKDGTKSTIEIKENKNNQYIYILLGIVAIILCACGYFYTQYKKYKENV